MRKRQMISILLIGFIISSSLSIHVFAAGNNEVNVEVNDIIIDFDVQPIIVNNRTLVPLRAIFEAMEMDVTWEASTQSVTATNKDYEIVLTIDQVDAFVNGEKVVLDVPATIVNNRTLVPLRFIGESVGASVIWESVTSTALIYTSGYIPPEFADDDVMVGEMENNNVSGAITEVVPDQYKEDIELLREKITFINDEKLFLVYAFMIYTGFDEADYEKDLERGKISEVKKLLLEELESMNLELMNDRYYADIEARYGDDVDDDFMGWYISTTAYPEFDVPNRRDDNIQYFLEDLDDHLIEFYEKANIHDLYIKYEPYYEKVLDMYRADDNLLQLAQVLDYTGVDIEDVPAFGFQVNLLNSWDNGLGLCEMKHIPSIEVITTGGNDDKANTHNFVHEFLHSIVNNVIDDDIGLKRFTRSQLFAQTDESDIYEIFVEVLNVMQYEDEVRRLSLVEHDTERFGQAMLYVYNKFYDEYPSFEGSLAEFVELILY